MDFDYVQLASGTVNADIEGAALFDRLNVTGSVTLAGTMKPFFIGGFTPAPGDRFPVIGFSGSRTGTVGLGSGTGLCLEYSAAGLELVKRAIGCAFGGGVAHDSRQLRDLAALPDGSARADHFLISQQPHSSYEVVVDGTSADLSAGAGPALDLVGSDGLTVLKGSLPAGASGSRSLRFENADRARGRGAVRPGPEQRLHHRLRARRRLPASGPTTPPTASRASTTPPPRSPCCVSRTRPEARGG